MKKLLKHKKEIIVFFIVFFIGFSIAPTGVDSNRYNALLEQNESKIKALEEKEEQINSLKPKIEEIKNKVNTLNKELESKKQ